MARDCLVFHFLRFLQAGYHFHFCLHDLPVYASTDSDLMTSWISQMLCACLENSIPQSDIP